MFSNTKHQLLYVPNLLQKHQMTKKSLPLSIPNTPNLSLRYRSLPQINYDLVKPLGNP